MSYDASKPKGGWLKSLDDIARRQSPEQRERYQQKITDICDIIAKSATGKLLLTWVQKKGVHILIDPDLDEHLHGLYVIGRNTLILSDKYETDVMACYTAHEMRHAWQDGQDFIPISSDPTPDEIMIRTRLIEADAMAYQLQVSAELYAQGMTEQWNKMIATNDIQIIYKGCLDYFLKSVQGNLADLKTTTSMPFAFNGWFDSKARELYDERSLTHYIYIYEKHLGYDKQTKTKDLAQESTFTKDAQVFKDDPIKKKNGINFTDKNAMLSLFNTLDGQSYISNMAEGYLNNASIFGAEYKDNAIMKDLYDKAYGLYRKHFNLN